MSELVVSERARREPSPASHDAARILDRPEGESCAGEWFGAHELELVARFCIVALLCALASPVLASPVHEQNTEVDHILAAQQTRLCGLAEWRLPRRVWRSSASSICFDGPAIGRPTSVVPLAQSGPAA